MTSNTEKTKMSTWQAACTIAGYGVGSSIMALPFLAEKAGFWPSILLILVAFAFNFLMHTMLAEIALGAGGNCQVVSMFRKYVFRGKAGNAFFYVVLVLCIVMLTCNLASYIVGGATVLESWGMPTVAAKLVFYVFAAIVALFGLKILGVSESVGITVIIAIILALAVGSIFNWNNNIFVPTQDATHVLAFFGMLMMAFSAFFSVPQAVEGLGGNHSKIRHSIALGLGLNALFVLVVIICALASSTEVTELAVIGWSAGIGSWAQVLGSVFTIVAMLTTYWSISLALSDVFKEQFAWNKRICWLLATLPSVIIVLLNLGGFLDFMRTASGIIGILVAFLVIPAFRICHKEDHVGLLPDALSGTPVQIVVIISFVLMAVGSAVSI